MRCGYNDKSVTNTKSKEEIVKKIYGFFVWLYYAHHILQTVLVLVFLQCMFPVIQRMERWVGESMLRSYQQGLRH